MGSQAGLAATGMGMGSDVPTPQHGVTPTVTMRSVRIIASKNPIIYIDPWLTRSHSKFIVHTTKSEFPLGDPKGHVTTYKWATRLHNSCITSPRRCQSEECTDEETTRNTKETDQKEILGDTDEWKDPHH